MLCGKCGVFNDEDAAFCRKCGSKINPNNRSGVNEPKMVSGKYKDPGLAGVFSAIFPGFGQIYNENLWKGIILFIIALFIAVLFLSFLIVNSANQNHDDFYTGISLIFILFVVPYFIVWIIGVYDAQKSARRFNESN